MHNLPSDFSLSHYKPEFPITVTADIFSCSLRAYIFLKFSEGCVKFVFHASRSLTTAESKTVRSRRKFMLWFLPWRNRTKWFLKETLLFNQPHNSTFNCGFQSRYSRHKLIQVSIYILDILSIDIFNNNSVSNTGKYLRQNIH